MRFQIIMEGRIHIIKNFENFIKKEHGSSRGESGDVKNLSDISQISIFGTIEFVSRNNL